jgi:hypothetical protein
MVAMGKGKGKGKGKGGRGRGGNMSSVGRGIHAALKMRAKRRERHLSKVPVQFGCKALVNSLQATAAITANSGLVKQLLPLAMSLLCTDMMMQAATRGNVETLQLLLASEGGGSGEGGGSEKLDPMSFHEAVIAATTGRHTAAVKCLMRSVSSMTWEQALELAVEQADEPTVRLLLPSMRGTAEERGTLEGLLSQVEAEAAEAAEAVEAAEAEHREALQQVVTMLQDRLDEIEVQEEEDEG